MAGAIHSSLEEAAADGACDEERARLSKLLSTLTDLVQRWSPQRQNDITGTLFAISDGSAVNRA